MPDFTLSASLKGHEDDVRDVVFTSGSTVLTCSRDSTVRLWTPTQAAPPRYEDSIALQGSTFVNAVAYVASSNTFPNGLIVSGGKDAIIDVRQCDRPIDAQAERILLGHEGNICSLDVSPDPVNPRIVSGSWDCSARVWDITRGEAVAVLEGHEASVWAVLWYDVDTIITACADHHVRVFSAAGKLRTRFKASDDVVRALCRLPATHNSRASFASAGNDGVIKLWALDGSLTAQLVGHNNFIYCLACLPSGELVSSSEDRTIRIWSGTDCIQTITHPAISVWSVATSADGDIVTGASDRVARVFTRSSERQGSNQAVAEFNDAVRSSAIPKQQIGDINKEQLPGVEFLSTKSGTKDGQVQLIREADGNVSAHTWSATAQQWTNVGTVVDASGSSGRKTEFMGKDYDYVFDVDIEEGKPPLKLPFNLSQNPYEVAQSWIASHELPSTYIDQVANFIITNTQGATLGGSTEGEGADPWGSNKRYRPGDTDPETARPPAEPKPKTLPQTSYLTITTASFNMVQKKLIDFNRALLDEGRKDVALNPSQLDQLPFLIKELEASAPGPQSAKALDALGDIAINIMTQWPQQMRLPGLDIFRCLSNASSGLTQHHDVMSLMDQSEAFTNDNPNMAMLAIRALANLFGNDNGRQYANANFERVRATVTSYMQHSFKIVNRNVHIAITTLFINYAVLLTTGSQNSVSATDSAKRAADLLRDLTTLLAHTKVIDSETIYRAFVAVGTLLRVPAAGGIQIDGNALRSAVDRAAATSREPRIVGVVRELQVLL